MQKSLLTIAGLSATFFLIGCADDRARQQIADTNVKLSQMQQSVDLLGTKVSNQKLLDILNKLDSLQTQINELNGSLDTLKNNQAAHIATQEQINQSVQQQIGGTASPTTVVATTAEKKTETPETIVENPKKDDGSQELKTALKNIKNRKFSTANKELNKIIKTSNNPTIVANATYYLAISYAASGQYKSSIATAKKFIEMSPDNHNVPDALRTMYVSQIQLGMTKSAKNTANMLSKNYPDSDATKKVLQEQKSLETKK